jgi:hypothetical protein
VSAKASEDIERPPTRRKRGLVKLKIRKPIPAGDGLDGLTAAAHRLGRGEIVHAIVRIEAEFTEVAPDGEDLAVVATITAGEALDGRQATSGETMLTKAFSARTGIEQLPFHGEDD